MAPRTYSYPSLFQLPRRPRQTRRKGLPADRARHPEDESEDNGHRGGALLLQEPQLQALRRGWAEVGAEKVDPLFRGRHRHHLLCCHVRVRPSAARGRDHGMGNIIQQNCNLITDVIFSRFHSFSHPLPTPHPYMNPLSPSLKKLLLLKHNAIHYARIEMHLCLFRTECKKV